LGDWRITRLDGAAATREALLSSLPVARLFHYAGHADASGGDGLSSALVLAGAARLNLGDLLAVPRVPALVVLSACGAAGSGAPTGPSTSSMGLAQLFVASGAQAAVAPARDVRDDDARRFVTTFYAGLAEDAAGSFGPAFRRAALADPDDRTWESFRLVTP